MTDAELQEALALAHRWLGDNVPGHSATRLARAVLHLSERLEKAEKVCEGVAEYATVETRTELLLLHHDWMKAREGNKP